VRPHATTAPSATLSLAAGTIAAAGCVALLARPPLLRASADPTVTLVVLFGALLVAGLTWPARREHAVPRATFGVSVAIGIGAFAIGRVLGGGTAPGPVTARLIALNTLAAVSEEAFFRRFLYAVLVPSGAAVAVAGSALLFALVHVTVYGAWVLPIDLAAGALLGWQRWSTGSWRVPALTHAVANLLVVL
jgi:membrane protease YdiL (CAAX protease family)